MKLFSKYNNIKKLDELPSTINNYNLNISRFAHDWVLTYERYNQHEIEFLPYLNISNHCIESLIDEAIKLINEHY